MTGEEDAHADMITANPLRPTFVTGASQLHAETRAPSNSRVPSCSGPESINGIN